ncbi:MarR family winged helix-turn-helix transcriptional regulator [Actinomadura parmotrematis]|uniref:MarR family transcriptional regulator n=1 Tax=Actinomadura parmotrematis TaxID=2864039 RepID=A0ABS7G336_9ACTN|nr:MarR family transcriptional regulator [Actinomadura parmotrematis]MBW8487097.1 MarR family transcriptional regulator [Actinomadura parmotrematis]
MTESSKEISRTAVSGALVERAARSLLAVWRRAHDAAPERVPPSQLRALEAVQRRGVLNLRALAGELGVIPSSASRLCDRLEAAGLLARAGSDADRRQVTLQITAPGEELLRDIALRRQRDLEEVLRRMSPDGRERLLSGLSEFAAAASTAVRRAATPDG